jgi:hypothetical protein
VYFICYRYGVDILDFIPSRNCSKIGLTPNLIEKERSMEIIQVKNANEVKSKFYHAYVCEPSPQSAAYNFKEDYGIEVNLVYTKTDEKGRSSVFIPLTEEQVKKVQSKHCVI